MLTFTLILGSLTIHAADIGRFQLVTAKITTRAVGAELQTDTIFRIDTTTGQTWQFTSLQVGGKTIEAWEPVKESASVSRKDLQKDLDEAEKPVK